MILVPDLKQAGHPLDPWASSYQLAMTRFPEIQGLVQVYRAAGTRTRIGQGDAGMAPVWCVCSDAPAD